MTPNPNSNRTPDNKGRKPILYYYAIVMVILMMINLIVIPKAQSSKIVQANYSTFIQETEKDKVDKVQMEDNQILYTLKDDETIYQTGLWPDDDLTERLSKHDVKFTSKIVEQTSPLITLLVGYLIPILGFTLLLRFMMRGMNRGGGGGLGGGMGAFNIGKSNARVYDKNKQSIRFKDVAGEDEAKESLQEIVHYLQDPAKFKAIGATMPKGILLVGPPGTGKTLLAKAVAGESNVPFFSISGSEFVEMFVGMGASKVRDLFKQAKEKAPCIVFIDEIDAIGGKRNASGMGGNDEREQTLNQLLTEMDGFEGNSGVMILAATNRPENLDPALLRPGRFDRRVPVELPDMQGREDILKVHAKKVRTEPGIDYNVIARMASGASGAELANIINEAALRAVREGRNAVSQTDLEESIEVVFAGYQKKNAILTDREKLTVSYHEVGHALVAALQTHSAPVQKITIIPRTNGALGYTMQVEEGNHYLYTKQELENRIATLTGGRAAEEVVFNEITTGASNDIEQATKVARAMITRYGMSDSFDMVAMESVNNKYLGGDASLACSDATAADIDEKVVQLVREQHEKAKNLLMEHRQDLDRIAKYLYEKETITGEEFMDILTHPENYPLTIKHTDEK